MIDASGSYSDAEDGSALRLCPFCRKPIRWKDYGGLATLAWHYPDSIITQAVVTLGGEEVDDHALSVSRQVCGRCGAELQGRDFR